MRCPPSGVALGGHLAGAAPGHVPPLLGAPRERCAGFLVGAPPLGGVSWCPWRLPGPFRVPVPVTGHGCGSVPPGDARRCAAGRRASPAGAGPAPTRTRPGSAGSCSTGRTTGAARAPCTRRCGATPPGGAATPTRGPVRVVAPRRRTSAGAGRPTARPGACRPGSGRRHGPNRCPGSGLPPQTRSGWHRGVRCLVCRRRSRPYETTRSAPPGVRPVEPGRPLPAPVPAPALDGPTRTRNGPTDAPTGRAEGCEIRQRASCESTRAGSPSSFAWDGAIRRRRPARPRPAP